MRSSTYSDLHWTVCSFERYVQNYETYDLIVKISIILTVFSCFYSSFPHTTLKKQPLTILELHRNIIREYMTGKIIF